MTQWAPTGVGATDVAANARGDVWIIGNTPAGSDHNIYRRVGERWMPVAGATAMRIAVDPQGNAWAVTSAGAILHFTGAAWERFPGDAMDIGVGADGAVWIVGRDQSISRGLAASAPAPNAAEPTGLRRLGQPEKVAHGPQQYRWEKVDGAAVRIAVDGQGNPWIVNAGGQIHHRAGNAWAQLPGSARDIAVDAAGVVYIVSATPGPGGFEILRSQGASWANDGIAAECIAAGPAGVVYAARNATAGDALMARLPNPLVAGTPPSFPTPTVTAQGATGIRSSLGATTPAAQHTPEAATPQMAANHWAMLRTAATDVGVNARGDAWIVGNIPPGRDHHIYRRVGERWLAAGTMAMRIAVDPQGNAWAVTSAGGILHFTGAAWEHVPGDAMDIGVGANGAVWIIGRDQSISRGVASSVPEPKPTAAPGVRRLGQPEPPQQYNWEKVDGGAVRIAVDPQGNPWVVNAGGQIYHRTGNSWTLFSGSAKDIAVDASGVVYIISTTPAPGGFAVMRSQGATWTNDGIAGESIAAGPAGVVYVSKDASGGSEVLARIPNATMAGSPPLPPLQTPQTPATAAIPATTPSAQTSGQTTGQIPIPVQSATIQIQPSTNSVSINAPSQAIPINPPTLITSTTAPAQAGASQPAPTAATPPANLTLNQPAPIQLNQVSGSVMGPIVTNQPSAGVPLGAMNVTGAPTGTASVGSLTTGSLVVPGSSAGSPIAPSSTPLTVTGLNYTPIVAPAGSQTLISGLPYAHLQGKLLCSDPEAMNACGNVDAGYVGSYTLNTSCSDGFYDMTQGGTCWKCPDDDGHGSWIRSADAVTADTACWRNATSAAVFDKHGLSLDCSGNQFWDSQDNNKTINGSCWHCPDDFSTRSADPVWSSTACYSHQTHSAAFLKFNGCPAPDKTQMYPNDARRPGEPFLDIASGLSVAGNAGGACWACPVTDEQGNYLYTERNANTLIGSKTGNGGCTVGFRYKPGTFTEPGLSSLQGVADVLAAEQVFQRPAALTTFLYGLAQARNLPPADAANWVAAQWQDIAAHPYKNAQIRALMYEYLTGGAPPYMYASGDPASSSTDSVNAHTKLVNSFQDYIRARRTHVAQESLDMYYQWKKNVDVTRSLHAESELQTLFYYGTVPLDYQSIVAAALAPTVTATAVLTSVVAAENFSSTVQNYAYKAFPNNPKSATEAIERQFRVSRLLSRIFKPTGSGGGGGGAADAEAGGGPKGLGGAGGSGAGEIGAETAEEAGTELAAEAAGETTAEAAAEGAAILMAQIDLVSGPVGIALAGATMAAIAIQQVVEINQAEPNLLQAKQKAMQAVSLSDLLKQENGPDQAATYWASATGVTTETENRQILAAAQSAYAQAQQSRFAQLSPPSPQPAPAQQAATSQFYTNFMNASATLLQQLRRVTDGPSANSAQMSIQNALTTYNTAKARLPGANLGSDQTNAASSAMQQVNAEITRIKGIPAAAQALGETFATTRYHGVE